MWMRTLIVAFGIALGVGLCAYIARRISGLGGRGAAGTALRWGLFPLAVFLAASPLLAMHGLLRALAGMSILMTDICAIFFLTGLLIGLWKEAAAYDGPFVMDPTIALNRPVKKIFSLVMLAALVLLLPWAFSRGAVLVLEDLTDVAMNFPELLPGFESFCASYAPAGIAAALAAFVSLTLSLAYDWTVGALIEAALTAFAKRR